MGQLDLFGSEKPAIPSASGDPDRVRRKLAAMLEEARSAGEHGLPQARRRLIEVIVPQMTRWLPEEEADRVKAEFREALAA